jgi:hypothetical protein
VRKKNKPLYFSVAVILILLGVIFFLLRNKTTAPVETGSDATTEEETQKVEETSTPTALVVDKSLVEEKKSSTSTKYATINVTYPQFKNASDAFNKEISSFVNTAVSEHNKISEENWKARYENQSTGENISEFPKKEDLLPLTITWTPVQVNGNYISLVVSTDEYSGGAHGSQSVTSFNYNVKQKKEVSLKDLFPNDSNYLKTLSDFSRSALETQFRKALAIKTKDDETNFKEVIMPMLLEGTKPTAENFSIFTFTDGSINIYFAEYQVGPYVLGAPKVSYTRK